MQQTIQLQRSAQRAFSIQSWLNAKSDSFSLLMGETVTNLQVILVHLILLFLGGTVVAIEASLSLALLLLACAAWAVYRLNMTEKGGEQ